MAALIVLGCVVGLAALALTYYIYCMPLEKVAAKMGQKSLWMAYVPFARNVLRMRMVGMPTWKFMFVGSTFFTVGISTFVITLITWLLGLIHPIFGAVVGIILLIVYLVFYFIATFEYDYKLATAFDFDATYTAIMWMFVPLYCTIASYQMALDNRYTTEKSGKNRGGNGGGNGGNDGPAIHTGEVGLTGVSGMYAGASFTMKPNEEFVIGRDSVLANIIISANGDNVSRRHCSVKFNSVTGCYEVTDFSSNGTFYGNTRLLKGQSTSIPRGTTIVIGDKMNQFKLM